MEFVGVFDCARECRITPHFCKFTNETLEE
jgi:hypothetical protein